MDGVLLLAHAMLVGGCVGSVDGVCVERGSCDRGTPGSGWCGTEWTLAPGEPFRGEKEQGKWFQTPVIVLRRGRGFKAALIKVINRSEV